MNTVGSALVCPHMRAAGILYRNLLLLPLVLNASRQSMQAEVTFLTATWNKVSLLHPGWSWAFTIPLKSNGKVQQSKTQINLKLASAAILIVVFPFQLFGPTLLFAKSHTMTYSQWITQSGSK